ncbi:MAG TPA: 30S ribosomal protein S13 [Candidatus Nanoarchaeia archaeon]|nr:30S ribosomal protein S13 [Candidatus Nanoarchaeia archaeon]
MKKIIRIRKVDLMGDKKVGHSLTKIKGIDFMMSNAILNTINIDPNLILGDLSDADLEKIREVVESPAKLKLPKWLLNRRKDIDTGADMHLTGMDLPLAVRDDVKRMQETKTRKGIRHAVGLKVRGQRTQAHPRHGRTVGVITKKKAAKLQKSTGPAKEEKKESPKKEAGKKEAKK